MAIPSIDADRLWQRLMCLAEIGATPKGGVDRQALSEGETKAWRLAIGWAEEAGLVAETDEAANLFLIWKGRDPALPPVMAGSHLDSQPTGGKFDGAFGVMAALEAVTTLAALGRPPERDVIVVAWMNEEGSRFAPGMMGSEAFAGVRPIAAIRAVKDAKDISAGAEIDRQLAAFSGLPRRPLGFPLFAYVEPHIEQHTLLEQAEKVIGIVTGIQGKKTFEVMIEGTKGHAGTLAMRDRRDAVVAFAEVMSRLQAQIGRLDRIKFTVGQVLVEPNAPSIVPEGVRFRVDLRHPDNAVLERCGEHVERICVAAAKPCDANVMPLVSAASNEFDSGLRELIVKSAQQRGFPSMPLLSYAGHDARQLAPLCPSAMIFIPCRGGVSHDENEWAEPRHVAAGTQVLCDVLFGLCGLT
jgi:N-carbamoyl-L-amino-acid hydrolase